MVPGWRATLLTQWARVGRGCLAGVHNAGPRVRRPERLRRYRRARQLYARGGTPRRVAFGTEPDDPPFRGAGRRAAAQSDHAERGAEHGRDAAPRALGSHAL